MSSLSGWAGTLKQLRIDPCNAVPGSQVSGSFQLDYVQIGSPVWEFANTAEGWTAENYISGYGWQSSGYIGGTITGTDAFIKSADNLNIDISNKKYVSIRIKNNTSLAIGQVYFTTAVDNSWNEAKHKDFVLQPNSDFTVYTIDMSDVSAWAGDLRQLRIDPCNAIPGTPASGTFQIDYINISNAENGLFKEASSGNSNESRIMPGEYKLEQNYPNPFNPETVIKYNIPKDGLVSLKVYNILGVEIATLINKEQSAGSYSVNFNASGLSSGVYLYKLQAGTCSISKKMLLLK